MGFALRRCLFFGQPAEARWINAGIDRVREDPPAASSAAKLRLAAAGIALESSPVVNAIGLAEARPAEVAA